MEGHECLALEGMRPLLAQGHPRTLVVETDDALLEVKNCSRRQLGDRFFPRLEWRQDIACPRCIHKEHALLVQSRKLDV